MKKILFLIILSVSVSVSAQTTDTIRVNIYPDGATTVFKFPIIQGGTLLGCIIDQYYPYTTTPQYPGISGSPLTLQGVVPGSDTGVINVYNITNLSIPPYALGSYGRQRAYVILKCAVSQ